MTEPKHIFIKDYTYTLPEECIAKYPLAQRDASKLLIYQEGFIEEDIYQNVSAHIPEGSLLVFNNTKVIEARLLFQKPSGGIIEIFCLEPHTQYADITTAMMQQKKVWWHCLVGGASKWKNGQILEKKIIASDRIITLNAKFIEKRDNYFIIELYWSPEELHFAEVLHFAGAIPLPPYIKRKAEESDKDRYQTIYAKTDGSVAAPTAGLHFTQKIFDNLNEKNIHTAYATLHVGAGTFQPVKSDNIQEHEMHTEWIEVSEELIDELLNQQQPIIAVGTTSLRTLESLYWIGLKLLKEDFPGTPLPNEVLFLKQWEAYQLMRYQTSPRVALQAIKDWLKKNSTTQIIAKTQILIVPGYEFKIVNGLITNFHQPQSTLLLLVAAFLGDTDTNNTMQWKKIYDYALKNNFRFLSYGDGSLLWCNKQAK
ncbi:MAG: S-adenosylmethionine:tRNA ribosyltransferase-isomerase [Bacteroidetes bacterium]|nr:S-adenosylmethionine:tRNA ribosyltransferase-isomerase [Bacteroidota bacterium]